MYIAQYQICVEIISICTCITNELEVHICSSWLTVMQIIITTYLIREWHIKIWGTEFHHKSKT